MAGHTATFVDWTDREVQREWFSVRHLLEHEVQSATEPARREFGISVRMDSATIFTLDGIDCLRVPVSAIWQNRLEQAIAYIVVTQPVEDDPRAVTVGEDVGRALERWVQREVPAELTPVLYYPETRSDWPAETPAAPPATPTPEQAAPPAEAPRPAKAATAPAGTAPAPRPRPAAAPPPAQQPSPTGEVAQPPAPARAVASDAAAKRSEKPVEAASTGTEQTQPMPPTGESIPTPGPADTDEPGVRGLAEATLDKTGVPRVRAENVAAMGSTEAPATPAEAAASAQAQAEIVEGGDGKAGGETPSETVLPKSDGEA